MILFEDKIDIINREIDKRRGKWQLKAISWMDFSDVKQLLLIHVDKKWHLWDQDKALEPWLNRLITNRMTNIIRDNYSSFSRPCLRCSANQGDDLCHIYTKQCSECPIFRKWEKTKKRAHDVKMPLSMHDERNEQVYNQVESNSTEEVDYDKYAELLRIELEKTLKPELYKIYDLLYIQHLSDKEVAGIMGYKENNKKCNRFINKQLENHKKTLLEASKKISKNLFR